MREKCEKVGASARFDDWINFEMPDDHFPDKVSYNLTDVFKDLLNFSFAHLKFGGRLVFWFPVAKEELKSEICSAYYAEIMWNRILSFRLR